MNAQRARQIANSPKLANVTYNGRQIYIQHVDADSQTARVFPIDAPEEEQNVPLSQLIEHLG
ncbi:H-type small acid-soluble spore protein [Paenibacillus alvei]|uniref:H-type small acid-soluble spore protein n=1 Tax=Paenibacillus alvei TaxID=44250 RepID=A0ABT4GWE7_PAEAL|nr:H-type small acid-soluble spore protein [Paenibacillus alvei]EJW15230.1 small acid-soluble spore protein, H-type [Paenibacillus alvei DSM 29]MCY7484024.1 H-type small acid-soluble spore protein [Paenibacillus alvei]MCY9544276.1 H-type small acid-soluble spore protein [Paenibacillus alvei]MCY9702884.1 H-type small acid-soluble spore protein [Paenibacillus alvei]MCY9733199.1 H-type small acid-soluble spore protein [Paenibacillus alvei]